MVELKNADDSTLQAKIQKLEQRIQILEQRNVQVNALDELGTDDMGDMRAGRFLALLSGSNPTDPDANGSFMSAAGETFGAWLIKVGEVLNGQLQAGFGGGAMIWANGDGVADATGLNLNGIRYALRHYATDVNGANARYGRYEMMFENGKTIPGLALTYMDGTINTELAVNGGFETDDFTGWSIIGSPSIASPGYLSNYCCSISGNTNNFINTLTGIGVTPGQNYIISFNFKTASSAIVYAVWYDGGGVILKVDAISTTANANWFLISKVLIAPPTAATLKLQIHCGITGTSYFDNVSIKAVGIVRQLIFGPELEISDVASVRKVLTGVKELFIPLAPVISLVTTASGNCDNGAHKVKITFVDSEGETLPSTASNSVTVDASHKQITVPLPIGPWGTTGRNVYMTTVADATTWYLAATIADNTTTTTNLSISDANLAAAAAAPGYNTTGSRPLFPRSAQVFGAMILGFTAAGSPITIVTTEDSSQRYRHYCSIGMSSANGDRYQIPMYLEAGTYTIEFLGLKTSYGGIFSLYVDGVVVATGMDLYAASTAYNVVNDFTNITITGSGYHLIEFVATGSSGSGARFPVTCISAWQAKY